MIKKNIKEKIIFRGIIKIGKLQSKKYSIPKAMIFSVKKKRENNINTKVRRRKANQC